MARNPETRKNVGKNRHVIENAYNYLIQGAASWIKQGQDRVALRNLAKAHLARMGQKATMQNIKETEDQLRAASVLVSDMDSVPSYPMEKRSTPARESVTDIPGYEKYIQDIERQSPFVPIGVEERQADIRKSPGYPFSDEAKAPSKAYQENQRIHKTAQAIWDRLPEGDTTPGFDAKKFADAKTIKADSAPLYVYEGKPDSSTTFNKDDSIFHQIAYSLSQLTGQEPRVESSDPRKRYGAFKPDPYDTPTLKKGGKVKKKKKKKSYTSKKKYSMSGGGKVASTRKPTRA